MYTADPNNIVELFVCVNLAWSNESCYSTESFLLQLMTNNLALRANPSVLCVPQKMLQSGDGDRAS